MISLIHGENITASRSKLSQIREDFRGEVLDFSGKDLVLEVLTQAMQSQSFFGEEKKLIIIENLSSNKNLWENLPDGQENIDLVLWEGKKLASGQVRQIQTKDPGVRIEEFKENPVVFKFVESLIPGNQKIIIPLWREYIACEQIEIAFVMIVRQIRMLILSKEGAADGPEEWLKLSPWQRQRLSQQASYYGLERLRELFARLLETDYQNKSGRLPYDLATALELFLLSL